MATPMKRIVNACTMALTAAVLVTSCRPTDAPAETAREQAAALPHPDPAATGAVDPSGEGSSRVQVNASPTARGTLALRVGDASIRIESCPLLVVSPTVSRCDGDTHVDVVHAGRTQSILFTSLYLDSEATFYRGPLDGQYRQNGHSFILTDVNADNREDLIVWTGREGAYGGASYEVLLNDPVTSEFQVAPMLSELTVGANGLFSIEDGRLMSSSSDGCCRRILDTFIVTNNEPRLVERNIQERDEKTGQTTTRTERLVDGRMQPVEK